MKDPVYAPVYCALYPDLALIARQFGYALAIHGSLARDLDVICIPWVDEVGDPEEVVEAITTELAIVRLGDPEQKSHGRIVYTISIGHGECAIDLSFTPAERREGGRP